MCNAAKAVFRGTFLGLREYTRKKWSQLIELSFHLKKLGEKNNKKKTKAKISRGKEIKIRAEINEIENKNNREKSMKQKSWFLEIN